MIKASLIDMLAQLPDDAEIVAWNPDSNQYEPVTGMVHGPQANPYTCSDVTFPRGTIIAELCTDEP